MKEAPAPAVSRSAEQQMNTVLRRRRLRGSSHRLVRRLSRGLSQVALAALATLGLAMTGALAWAAVAVATSCGPLAIAFAAERAIEKQVDVPATVDEVWAAWTTRDGVRSFFAPEALIEPRVGGAFHIHFDPGAPAGARGADDMRFLALQPKRMISFDWNAPPSLPEARQQRTFVIVRMHALDDKTTRVTLHHTGWGDGGEWDRAHAYFDRAWGAVLGNLRKRFEQGPIDWKPWLERLEQARSPAARPASAAPAAAASR